MPASRCSASRWTWTASGGPRWPTSRSSARPTRATTSWSTARPAAVWRTVRELKGRGRIAGHLAAAPAYGGDGEAISTAGALHHAAHDLGWDAVVCGPGPGILGSASALGHGGMAALDTAHAA